MSISGSFQSPYFSILMCHSHHSAALPPNHLRSSNRLRNLESGFFPSFSGFRHTPKKVSRPLFSTSKSIQCLSHLPPQLGFHIANSVERSLKTSGISSTTDQPLAANLRPSRL